MTEPRTIVQVLIHQDQATGAVEAEVTHSDGLTPGLVTIILTHALHDFAQASPPTAEDMALLADLNPNGARVDTCGACGTPVYMRPDTSTWQCTDCGQRWVAGIRGWVRA